MAEMTELHQELKNLSAVLEVKEIAAILHVDISTVYRLIQTGELKGFRPECESLSITKSDFAAFCEKNETI